MPSARISMPIVPLITPASLKPIVPINKPNKPAIKPFVTCFPVKEAIRVNPHKITINISEGPNLRTNKDIGFIKKNNNI